MRRPAVVETLLGVLDDLCDGRAHAIWVPRVLDQPFVSLRGKEHRPRLEAPREPRPRVAAPRPGGWSLNQARRLPYALTIAFTDIEDSTRLNASFGGRAWFDVLRVHNEIVTRLTTSTAERS